MIFSKKCFHLKCKLNTSLFTPSISRTYYSYVNEPCQIIPGREPKYVTADEAAQCVKTNDKIFIHGQGATPVHLIEAILSYALCAKLKGLRVYHMHTEGPGLYAQKEYEKVVRSVSFFMAKNVRVAVAQGRADAIPIFLHEIPMVFYRKIVKPDIALLQVSPPDKHGFCSLGISVDCSKIAMEHSKIIIAQINKNMPRTFGDGIVHLSHFDYAVCQDTELPIHGGKPPSDVETKIGKIIADELVEDGCTLQMGIGNIPDAVLAALHNHKDLGLHSEMMADGVVDLIKAGAVTNRKKRKHQGRMIGSFLIGTKKLYDFVNNNPVLEMLNVNYVNSVGVVRKLPQMCAINSCIEIDLTGQVSSDSIGTRLYSGFGGQVDFLRGAAETYDMKGKPILAFPSATNKGQSKISPYLKPGAGIVTTRSHVDHIVTEYGRASLFGKTYRQRAHALIQIAHPDHRESLEKAAFERLKVMPSPDN